MRKNIIFILIISATLYAQAPAKKWVIIQDLESRIVYLDTTAIKEYENQLSVWGLTVFRNPQRVTPFVEEVYQIKSNLLFNSITNTYSVIGTLYYDRSGKIIGESTAPRITGGEGSFELPVQPGSSIEILYQKAFTYKTTGTLESEVSEFLANTDFSKERPRENLVEKESKDDTITKPAGPVVLSPEQNIALIDESNIETIKKRDSIAAIQRTNLADNRLQAELKPIPPSNRKDLSNVNISNEQPRKKTSTYDNSNDSNVRGNIWTDGTKYVIQHSSWRSENEANSLVDKMKTEGHNSFVMRVELPRRGTWYRVRIGYFDTLQEAENYKRNNNL